MNALSPEHREELNSSRISSELIEQRGYMTVGIERRADLDTLGVPAWATRDDSAFPGLLLPMYRVTGEVISHQFKPAVPQLAPGKTKAQKYTSLRGHLNRLDVPPSVRHLVQDVTQPLMFTEGIKKADSLATRGMAVVALTGVWNWKSGGKTLGDFDDIPLRGRAVAVCFDSDALTNPEVRTAMIRFVEWLKSKGATAYYLPVPPEVNGVPVKGVDDYFAAGGELTELSAGAVPELARAAPKDAAFSDAYLTDTMCDESLTGRFLWAKGLGWMRYDGVRWAESDDAQVVEEIRLWAMGHWDEILELHKKDQSSAVRAQMEGWRQLLQSSRLRALAGLAKGPLHAEASDFDPDPDLLNCPNGVVDLRTGELTEHDPAYRMTKVCGADYDPDADSEDFRTALGALPEELHDWYQVRVGQAFTGHMTPDDMLIVQQGGGENGKSTLNVPFRTAAGSYAVKVSHRVLISAEKGQHPTELMDFRGARYAMMEETPEARRLDVQKLREIVGTPEITARHIRQDSVTFDVSHSLFVNTNFAPAVTESDHGTWRRMCLVKFPFTYRKRAADVIGPNDRLGDPGLRDRCRSDAVTRAALAWAVRGAVRWYGADRVMPELPEPVQRDTRAWRAEGDLILSFAQECLEFGPEYVTPTAVMLKSFTEWLFPQGHKPWSAKLLKSRFEGHDEITSHRVSYGTEKINGKATKVWSGVRVVSTITADAANTGVNPFST